MFNTEVDGSTFVSSSPRMHSKNCASHLLTLQKPISSFRIYKTDNVNGSSSHCNKKHSMLNYGHDNKMFMLKCSICKIQFISTSQEDANLNATTQCLDLFSNVFAAYYNSGQLKAHDASDNSIK